MKKHLILMFAIFAFSPYANFACGPWFPATYLDNGKYSGEPKTFEPSYSWERELQYIAFEKFANLADWPIYPDSKLTTKEAEDADLQEKLSTHSSILELELYKAGKLEMQKNNNPEKIPESWQKLLNLPPKERKYRTTWVYYMIGNLYSLSGKYETAKKCYQAVRGSYRKGFKDTLGLAHATYKREFLSATSAADKLNAALKAVAYYLHAEDYERYDFIQLELYHYINKLQKSTTSIKPLLKDQYLKELIVAFNLGKKKDKAVTEMILNREIDAAVNNDNGSETVSRFAWSKYRDGDINSAKKLLKYAKKDDILTLWLSAKIAIYDGEDAKAAEYLRRWLKICTVNKDKLKDNRENSLFINSARAEKEIYGTLGNAIIHTKDFKEALDCFIRAEDWLSTALVAEKLMSIKELTEYVDRRAPEYNKKLLSTIYTDIYTSEEDTEKPLLYNNLRYLLARRLVRNNMLQSAITYMPPSLIPKLKELNHYIKQYNNRSLSNNQRAAGAYNAARIMRWYGMSLSGTELWPDYHYCEGEYDQITISPNWSKVRKMKELTEIAEKHSPEKRRFHYRFQACRLMQEASKLSENRRLKFLANLAAGYWLYKKYPKTADPFYKAASGFHEEPLALILDQKRWFPAPKTLPEKIYKQIFSTEPVIKVEEVNGRSYIKL